MIKSFNDNNIGRNYDLIKLNKGKWECYIFEWVIKYIYLLLFNFV